MEEREYKPKGAQEEADVVAHKLHKASDEEEDREKVIRADDDEPDVEAHRKEK